MTVRLSALLLAALPLAACSAADQPPATTAKENAAVSVAITDLKEGSGPAVAAGQAAVVHYTGWLFAAGAPDDKGRKFDSSHDHGQPFTFHIGAGEVIAGWDQGVAGMKVGGQRRLVIPPELGYGARGAGGVIPPGATLVFDVELVGIR
ncbi:MAG: FKBP-type peptidyl-prolyl cis-trans isomerase [Steroidobacteraceae bacterium]